MGEALQLHSANGMTAGVEVAGKTARSDALKCRAEVGLKNLGQIGINACKVFVSRIKIDSGRRVVDQLIARSHKPARWRDL